MRNFHRINVKVYFESVINVKQLVDVAQQTNIEGKLLETETNISVMMIILKDILSLKQMLQKC